MHTPEEIQEVREHIAELEIYQRRLFDALGLTISQWKEILDAMEVGVDIEIMQEASRAVH
jgi:hypothetical protein